MAYHCSNVGCGKFVKTSLDEFCYDCVCENIGLDIMNNTPKTKRFTITIDYDTYQAIEVFSNAMGQTKSETVNQLMSSAADSLRSLARVHFEAQTMTKQELDNLTQRLSKIADETVSVRDKLVGDVVNFPIKTPL